MILLTTIGLSALVPLFAVVLFYRDGRADEVEILQNGLQTQDQQLLNTLQLEEVSPHSFIFSADNALSVEVCNDIIQRFEDARDEQYPGRIGQTESENLSIKRSTDLVVSGKSHWQDVDRALFQSLAAGMRYMQDKSVFFHGRFKDYGYAVQKTQPGEFFHWHVDSGSHSFADRQLVAIWYLNDVEGPGGETEFLHQRIKITPAAGKLIIFPPFWTHEHRGVTLEEGVKYIATTWVLFA